jgi:hypothetical protein
LRPFFSASGSSILSRQASQKAWPQATSMRGTTPPAALYGSMQTAHAGRSTAAAAGAVLAGAVVGAVAGGRWPVAVATASAAAVVAASSRSACRSEKGVRLAHKMRVGPYIPAGIQTENAEVGPTSGPTWRVSHSSRRGERRPRFSFARRARPCLEPSRGTLPAHQYEAHKHHHRDLRLPTPQRNAAPRAAARLLHGVCRAMCRLHLCHVLTPPAEHFTLQTAKQPSHRWSQHMHFTTQPGCCFCTVRFLLRLGVDVEVILTSPCIFCMGNH